MRIADDLAGLIGRTPLIELTRLYPEARGRVLAKLELANPMSIKDRPVLNMIRQAIAEGKITTSEDGSGPVTEVVEASSGNTAIAIASLGAVMGYATRIFLSELCSVERIKILCAFGARVMVTPGAEHTRGARERAMRYCEEHPGSTFFPNQHGNPHNGGAHEQGTGPELYEQLGGELGAVVIGLGTSGTFDGVSRYVKARDPSIQIIGFEPASSPVYSGGAQAPHKLTGIGPGFVTENFERSRHNLDELILVEDEVGYEWTRRVARTVGLLVGPTSGAAAWVAGEVAKRPEMAGKNVVCFFYDTGERYLSTEGLFPMDTVEKVD